MSDIQIVLQTLPRIVDACRSRHPPGADRTELTPQQIRLLESLDVRDPVMVTELAEHMGVTASTMSLNLKRLREAGLVSRERDPADRRVMNVTLTEEGARTRDHFRELSPERVDALLRRVGPELRARVLQGLVALADAADAEGF